MQGVKRFCYMPRGTSLAMYAIQPLIYGADIHPPCPGPPKLLHGLVWETGRGEEKLFANDCENNLAYCVNSSLPHPPLFFNTEESLIILTQLCI